MMVSDLLFQGDHGRLLENNLYVVLFAGMCLSKETILKSRHGLSRDEKEEINRPQMIAVEAAGIVGWSLWSRTKFKNPSARVRGNAPSARPNARI